MIYHITRKGKESKKMESHIYDLKFTVRGIVCKNVKGLETEISRISRVIEAVLNTAPDDVVESFWYIANDYKKVEE